MKPAVCSRPRAGAALLALVTASACEGCGAAFLLASSPAGGAVHYARLRTAAEQARGEPMHVAQLTREGQLKEPMGLAVDSFRRLLFVADIGESAVLAFPLRITSGKVLGLDGDPRVILGGVISHGVAVDYQGSIFCSDITPDGSRILMLSGQGVASKLRGEEGSSVVELYSAKALAPVQEPHGVAVDGRLLFWTNFGAGASTGSLAQGLEVPPDEGAGPAVMRLDTQADGAYDVCLTGTRAFFTDDNGTVRSLRKSGGTVTLVSKELAEPRGCAWDGDGTIFVASHSDGRIYSFSGGAPNIEERPVVPVADVPGVYGLAVFLSGASAPMCKALSVALLVFALAP